MIKRTIAEELRAKKSRDNRELLDQAAAHIEALEAENEALKADKKQSEGEWVRQQGRPEAICSKCGREVVYQVIDNKWEFENFCPHCGTKMKGD